MLEVDVNVEDKVYEVLSKVFRVKKELLNQTTSISDVDNWDSLTHMDLILSLEEQFNITFDEFQIIEMINLASIIKIIREKLA